jgi:hypothetical protein
MIKKASKEGHKFNFDKEKMFTPLKKIEESAEKIMKAESGE